MGSRCGIVGLPNIGKSTLFNIIVGKEQAEVADYPFCTIEPNIASISIKDPKLNQLSQLANSKRVVYEKMELYDIAGLVKGASEGEGLGNQFLGNILQVDVIIHVVRLFQSESLEEDYDPVNSFEIIMMEMLLWDLKRLEQKVQNNKKSSNEETEELKKMLKALEKGERYISSKVNFPLISNKPIIVLGNGTSPKYLEKISKHCEEKNFSFFYFDFHKQEEKDLQNIMVHAYKRLDLITFYTCGPEEARAWTIKKGSTYKEAGGAIHSDFEKKFICANVISHREWGKITEEDSTKLSTRAAQEKYEKLLPKMKKALELVENGDLIVFKKSN